jgi:hypothetical protein
VNKQEFLSTSLPYGLKVSIKNNDAFKLTSVSCGSITLCGINDFLHKNVSQVTPIIRYIDTLNKECVQADYNEGRPFIPIVELGWSYRFFLEYHSIGINPGVISLEDSMMLLKWHFWPNMSEGEEVVYVSQEFNPYK